MIQIEKKLQDLEARARGLITEIVPIIGKIPKAALFELTEFLDDALQTAKINLNITKTETERRARPSWVSRTFMVLLIFVLPSLSSCVPAGYVKPTETHRQLNDQNEQIGQLVATQSDNPTLAQAGLDAKDNSIALRKTLIGDPQTKTTAYSPDVSAKLRQQAVDEFKASMPWYQKWAGYLVSGLGTLAVIAGFAARFFPATAPIANIVAPIATALVSMKQDADAHPQDVLSLDSITSKITALTKLPTVGPILQKLLEKAHVSALVHSPEASDPPPSAPATPTA